MSKSEQNQENPNLFPQTARVLFSLAHNMKEPQKRQGLPRSFQGIDMAMTMIRNDIGTELQYLTPAGRETVIKLLEMAIERLQVDSLLVLQKHTDDTGVPISVAENCLSMMRKMEEENRPPRAGRDECG